MATWSSYPHPSNPLLKDADPIIPSLSSADEVMTRPHTAKHVGSTWTSFTRTLFLKYLDSSFKCQTRCLCSLAKLTSFISLPFSRCRESVVLSGQSKIWGPFICCNTHTNVHINVLQPHWGQTVTRLTTKSNSTHSQIPYTSVIRMVIAHFHRFVVRMMTYNLCWVL